MTPHPRQRVQPQNENISISEWGLALNDERQTWSREVAPAREDGANTEHESGHTENRRDDTEDVNLQEVKLAIKN